MALTALLYSPDRFGAVHDAGLSIAASFPLLFLARKRGHCQKPPHLLTAAR